MSEAFKTNVLFENEEAENVVTTILILVGLKSFEFIIKSLLTSTRQESVNTGKYALEIAADQAYNPLNYIKWARGKPDFPHDDDKGFRKPIPLNRATLAVLICLMVLLAEAAFFYLTMSKTRQLTNEDLTLSVQTTNKHIIRKFTKNFCAPINVETGRSQMTAVFAFCNEHTSSGGGTSAMADSRNVDVEFIATSFAQTVKVTDRLKVNVSMTSKTVFSILVPDIDEHLVVPYNATNALISIVHAEVMNDFKNKRKCTVNETGRANGRYELSECQHEVDLDELMRLVLSYTELNNKNGTVGHEVGSDIIAPEKKKIPIGVIEEHKMSMVGLLAVSLTLFAFALLCHIFVKNNNSDVIAAMMREKTLQDMRVPAFSMDEEVIHIDRHSSEDDEGKSLQRTVHLRQSLEGSVTSAPNA